MIIKKAINRIRPILFPKQKVFCIGCNKTGTTSLAHALRELGYIVGNQSRAELLFDKWVKRDFRRIIKYCRAADAFQDIPFSLDYTYQAVDQAFPNSKFILTIRNSSEEWYNSLVRFHSRKFGAGHLPSENDLSNAEYCYKGFTLRVHKFVYNYPAISLYDKVSYIKNYENHNTQILEYFRHRPKDLLVFNIADNNYEKLCSFLNVPYTKKQFPWLNKS